MAYGAYTPNGKLNIFRIFPHRMIAIIKNTQQVEHKEGVKSSVKDIESEEYW